MYKVSVIVPIYNSSEYLGESIESLLGQDLKELEIILVNDGSVDNSLSICESYAKKNANIKVINKTNGGVSSARNCGIDVATGEYIGFVDPDDILRTNMYSQMYDRITKDYTDVVMCNFSKKHSNGDIDAGEKSFELIKEGVLSNKEIIDDLIPNMIAPTDLNSNSETIMGTVWRLLIKRELIVNNNIKFIDGISFKEDLLFSLEVLLKASNLSVDRNSYYQYIINDNSALTSYKNNLEEKEEFIFKSIELLVKPYLLDENLKNRMNIAYIEAYRALIVNEFNKSNKKSEMQKIICIKRLCKNKYLNSLLKKHNINSYTVKRKIVLTCMKYKMAIMLYFYYKLASRVNDN